MGAPGGHRWGGVRKITSTLTIFFHFILRFWYHVFTCNWLRPRDSARSILERIGCTFSRASRPLPLPVGLSLAPPLPVWGGEVLLFLKAFL